MRVLTLAALVALAALTACSDPGPATLGDPLDDPELPARGHEDIHAWLDAGFYQSWQCEAEPHPARPDSGHSTNRICTNAVLAAATGEGPYPVGSAAVKEVFDGDEIAVYAVYRKVADGAGGDTWYWYEGSPDNVIANGQGDGTCTGCHGRAPRDFVYVRATPQ
ncbi:MAG: hypothetical protein ABI867_41420 [Kofleriaceae bacterium]